MPVNYRVGIKKEQDVSLPDINLDNRAKFDLTRRLHRFDPVIIGAGEWIYICKTIINLTAIVHPRIYCPDRNKISSISRTFNVVIDYVHFCQITPLQAYAG